MRIPKEFIDNLKNRARISDVVGKYVSLKPHINGELKACCPFHAEKTPSFTVSQKKNFYYCFGCGASGDSVNS